MLALTVTASRRCQAFLRSGQARASAVLQNDGQTSRKSLAPRLEGKVALVTGAGSSGPGWGTGKAIAVAMAREGASIGLIDLNEAAAEETADIIRVEGGRCAVLPRCNVSMAAEVQNAVNDCEDKLGPISVLVNNVGLVCPGDVTNVPLEKWDLINAINLTGAFLCTKACVSSMLKAGHPGSVVNISSVSGIRAIRPEVAYCCSKAGMNALTVSVAREFASQQIRCNAILPGIIETPLVANAFKGPDLERVMAERHTQSPTRRMGDAWDIAHASVYLASDEAKYTNGLIMPVDGGLSTQLLPSKESSSLCLPLPTTGSCDFQDKVILVTGAVSLVGQAVADAFRVRGAKVFAVDRDVAAVNSIYGGGSQESCIAHGCDGSETGVQAMVSHCIDVFGKIDYLFNGPLPESMQGLLGTSSEEFARVHKEGATAVLLSMRFALPHMVRGGAGAIVNMSSLSANRYLRAEVAHAVTAGAVNALTFQTASAFANQGVRCNAIAPMGFNCCLPQDRDAYASSIAQAALHLFSEDARYTSGHLLTLDMSASAQLTF